MFETPFYTNSESAFDADSFNTKIDENDENFMISNSDGRPIFSTFRPNISDTKRPYVDELDDASFIRSSSNFNQIIENSQNPSKPRQLPVGPVSNAFSSPKQFSEAPSKFHAHSHSDHIFPDSFSKPLHENCSPISSISDVSTCDCHNATDFTASTKNDNLMDQMSDHPMNPISQIPTDSDSDSIEEPPDVIPPADRFDGSEIILRSGVHFNPVDSHGNRNPDWIICTADPHLTAHTPLKYTGDNGVVEGVLVARGQLSFVDGQPTVNSLAPIIGLTEEELESKQINPLSMIDPSSIPSEPFFFSSSEDEEDEFVQHIHGTFNNLLFQVTVNVSNTQYFQRNEWSCITNNIVYNMPQGLDGNVQLESNKIKAIVSVVDTPVNIVNNKLNIIEDNVTSNVVVQNHSINLINDEVNSDVLVQNHAVNVINDVVYTDAIVQNHSVNVINDEVNTDAIVQNLSVNVINDEVNSDAIVQNHSVNVIKDIVSTDAIVQDHSVKVIKDEVNTNAVIQNHTVNVINDKVNSDAIVQNHSVNVIKDIVNSDAIVQNHSVNVINNEVNTDAIVQNHSVNVINDEVNSDAIVQNHSVNVINDKVITDVIVRNHDVNVLKDLINSEAHVQNHSVDVFNDEINSVAYVQNHCVKVFNDVVNSEAFIQNHHVNVINEEVKSDVVIPHFVFNFVNEDILIDVPISRVVEKTAQASSVPDCSSNSSSPNCPHSSVAPNFSYSQGSSSEDADDGHNGRDSFSSRAVDDTNNLQWIIDRLKQINYKNQLEDLIHDIQMADIDLSLWMDITAIKTPIILMMYKLHTWIGVGTFYCPHCEDAFQSPAALHAHWKASHGRRVLPNEQAAIEHIYNLKLRWKIIDADFPDNFIRYRNIWSCPCHKCDYIVNNPNALACHIKVKHPCLESLRLEVGLFWAALIMFAKEENKLMTAKDLFDCREGALCLRCNHYIGQDANKVQQHTKSSHPAANVEGSCKLSRSITLKTCWLVEGIDDDEISTSNRDLEMQTILNKDQLQITEQERNAPARIEDSNTNYESSAESRRNHENRLRQRREKGLLIASDGNPENRLHDTSPVNKDDIDSENEDEDFSSSRCKKDELTKDDLLKFFQKSRGWIDKNNDDIENVVVLPKLWGDRLKKVHKKFVSLFEHEINNLLELYDSYINNTSLNLTVEDENILWEGVLAKIHLLIRKKTRECLHIPKFNTKKKNSRRIPKALDMPIQIKSASKFTSCIELIHELIQQHEDIDQPTFNVISDLKEKAVNFLSRAPEDFIILLGGDDLDKVDALLNSHNFEERIQFLHSKLEELEIKHCSNSSAAYKKFIQKAYLEDSKKTLDWFILNSDSPECTVPLESFVNDYGTSWKDVAIPRQNEEFKLAQIINDDDFDCFTKLLLDEKAIQSAIGSRSNMAAVGCDGVCNGIWKINKSITSKILLRTIKLMLKSGHFPTNLKACKTVMLYKKGDPNLTRSWRPITITSTLYRILMCHISRSMQTLNDKKRFICSQQKGFMKIPAGAAEHIINADEMIHHAARHHRSIYIVTIDFKDAFGSVPHKLIKRNLLDIGFDKLFVKSIMSSYKDCATKIVLNGGMSEAILFGKGVKQGCPLSPTLFNICIDPLLRKLNDMAVVDGYHWYNEATSVQAYADDVILFSDTEQGMCNLIKTVEDFCHYAGDMVINPKKCSSLSLVISNGARSTISNNFYIGNSDDDNNIIENTNLHGFTSYLGIPLAAHVNRKKHHVFHKISSMRRDVIKISESALKTTQTIDAIKRFIIPKLDYELLINAAPINRLKDMDAFIRGCISNKIGAHGLPTDWFYTAKKNGGLNLQSFIDRYHALKIRLYVGLRESKDDHIKRMVTSSDNDEMTFRDADRNLDSPFLNVPVNNSGCIIGRKHCGTSNLLNRTVKALHDIHFGLTHDNSTFVLKPLDDSNHELEQHEQFSVNTRNIMKILMKAIQTRHLNQLLAHPLKGHSFNTLLNSPISNFFINHKVPASDSIVNFAFKARLGSLFTGNLRSLHSGDADDGKCPRCGEPETAHHLLNGCPMRKHEFTTRHDAIVRILRDFLTNKKLITHANQAVHNRDGDRLIGPNASLRPDLWWWNGSKLTIVEVTVPYGMMTTDNEETISSLLQRRKQKLAKYNGLIDDCKQQFNCQAELLVIIVSSLGAIPSETIDDLKKITNSNVWKTLAKRMVITAIRESMFIYFQWHPNQKHNDDNNDNTHNSDEDNRNIDDTIDNSTVTDSTDTNENSSHDSYPSSMSDMDDSAWRALIGDEQNDQTESSTDVLESPCVQPYWHCKHSSDDTDSNDGDVLRSDLVQRSDHSIV